jgi:glutamine synthetase
VSRLELVALVCCDLGAIVRGRSLPSLELTNSLDSGVGWVPANHALTPLGPLAEVNPFGSTGDLRLRPDAETHVRLEGDADTAALEFVLCDIVETDGRPWECCPREFLRGALAELESELGASVMASFEHEFQLVRAMPAELPFSLAAQRVAEPFASCVMASLQEVGAQPERFMAEFADHQYEIPVAPAAGISCADRSVVVRETVREVARRHGMRASFAPLTDPTAPGNGAHIHFSLLDGSGAPLLYDSSRPGCLSELAERFAAGILLHADALCALCAPSPCSALRLAPHHWSAGAVCVGQRNREALLRIPPLLSLGDAPSGARAGEAAQMRLEYRAADAAANPYLALGALVRAGLDGVRRELPAPPILELDPSQLDPAERARYRVGGLPDSLEGALQALAEDEQARAWMSPLLYDAYVDLKRAELEAASGLDAGELCSRYAAAY